MSDNENFENGIEVFYWRGQKRYRCPKKWAAGGAPCQFDTYSLDVLNRHMREVHGLPDGQKGMVRRSAILGPKGEDVYVNEIPLSPDVRGASFKSEE